MANAPIPVRERVANYRKRCIEAGKIPPYAARILPLLEATNGGPVTERLLRYHLWERLGRKPPANVYGYVRDLRRYSGREIKFYPDAGFVLVRDG